MSGFVWSFVSSFNRQSKGDTEIRPDQPVPKETMKDLHSVITPSLLRQMHQARIPWARMRHITGKEMIREFFTGASHFMETAKPAWPALKAISEAYGPPADNVPDMMSFLPDPRDPGFPEQAFGMHVLIDQAPRLLFSGVDGRWTSWFDTLARKLYERFYDLDRDLQPWRRERWAETSFDYWVCLAMQFNASMTHQESVQAQEMSEDYLEELRRAVEHRTGHRDPARDPSEPAVDEYSFIKMVTGVDPDLEWELHEAAFYYFRVCDAHKPIIVRFGRYPYRNAIEGRVSTEQEREWIEATNHLAEAEPNVARQVKEDVDAGRWTPLGKGEYAGEPSDMVGGCTGQDLSSESKLNVTIRLEDGRC